MAPFPKDDHIRLYWMTGCSSCLRTKEFLQKHGVPFLSRNILEDASALEELAHFGLKRVPIVTRGEAWADGQVLRDVARLCGIDLAPQQMLPVAALHQRLQAILEGAARFLAQLPEEVMERELPNRPRTIAQLAWHIANIGDAFLEHEAGIPLTFESYMRVPAAEQSGRAEVIAYCETVRRRLAEWFAGPGTACDWSRRANVYYGEQTLHEFLERTVWHAGQHLRQLMWVLEGLGIAPDRPLGPETFAGLPMPEKVWDEA